MIERETFALLSMIQVYDNQFEVDQPGLDYWHEALKADELTDCFQGVTALNLTWTF